MPISITYLSSATGTWTPAALEDLLEQCRTNNAADGVTGVLLYAGGSFVQTLEGPAEAVDAVMAKVRQDPRHRDVDVLRRGEVAERSFADWSMGFRQVPEQRLHEVPGFTDYLRTGHVESAVARDDAAATIHRLFRDQMRDPLTRGEDRAD